MAAVADELDRRLDLGSGNAASIIRDVLAADYNPLPDRLPELGTPPTARPAVRGTDPGA
jgi:hypothetical protein